MRKQTPIEMAIALTERFGSSELALECVKLLTHETGSTYWYRVAETLNLKLKDIWN